MSSILNALKKIEKGPKEGSPATGPGQVKIGPENTVGRRARRLRPRTVVYCALFAALLAGGSWLLLAHPPLPAAKALLGKVVSPPEAADPANVPAGAARAPGKTDLEPPAGTPPAPRKAYRRPPRPSARTTPRKQTVAARKRVATPQTDIRVPGVRDRIPPMSVHRGRVTEQLKRLEKESPLDFERVQTAQTPAAVPGAPSRRRARVSNRDKKPSAPPARSLPPRTAGTAAADSSQTLTGFSVQAIAWAKNPSERIAVINGLIVREGEFVEGMHVAEIGLDAVSLEKGGSRWRLQCGR